MLSDYFKIAFRNIYKHKFNSLINVIGLAIGIASFLLIFLYINYEKNYDRNHKNADEIYRIVNIYDNKGVGENSASAPFPVAFSMLKEYPDYIKNAVRIFNFQTPQVLVEYHEKIFNEKRFFFADSTYFNIFDHEFIYGNPQNVLDDPHSVVITESTAKKYFGKNNPINKKIKFEKWLDLTVTGVIKDVPLQSHFKFNFLASLSSASKVYGGKLPENWVWNPCWTYILLKEDVSPDTLEKQFPAFVDKNFNMIEKEDLSMFLQPLIDIHLKSKLDYEIEQNSNILYIKILSALAVFLLLIAIINYVNLSTATSTKRSMEIGIKKVSGAYRYQLVIQFLLESVLVNLFAFIMALLIVELTIPYFNNYTGKELSLEIFMIPKYFFALILLVLSTGFISGAYPAIYLSSIKPQTIITKQRRIGMKNSLPRKILVTLQFSISIILIIGTIIVFSQLRFMRNTDLGFNKENVMILHINHTPIAKMYSSFKKDLLKDSNIRNVTIIDDIIGSAHNTHPFRTKKFPEKRWQFYPALVVRYDFVETFDIEILAGRDYSEQNKTDGENGILINEALVEYLGWESNEQALGKAFNTYNGKEKVIGVTNNFHATSLHEKVGPFVLEMKDHPYEIHFFMKYLAIKIGKNNKETIKYIEKKWMEYAPGRPFEYSFLNDKLDDLYNEESNLSKLIMVFTLILIFISSLGLFGLVSFMTQQRTKEIGIRKVLGANISNIIILLSNEFFKLILIANFIAWPIAYWVLTEWLSLFAYRVEISCLMFIVSGFAAVAITMTIIIIKAVKTSKVNPVDVLKYE
ncbi:MAG: ABC transporter permease [Bacteroidales bacterium]|nr:ABC transporter permease [Bacteroidales bacterium]